MIWIINVITPTVKCEMSSRFSSLSSENDLMLLSKKKLQARPGSNFFPLFENLNGVHLPFQ